MDNVEEKAEEVVAEKTEGKSCCGMMKKCKHPWVIKVIAAILVVVILGGGYYYSLQMKKLITKEEAQKKVEFLIGDSNPNVKVKGVVEESGLYKITIGIDKQPDQFAYVTKDGTKFIQQATDFAEIEKQKEEADKQAKSSQITEAEQKTDVPTVDLFVMSYCPYGLQMERGVLPVVEALGNKIKFNLKFVDYTLHGPKEVTENVNQYCIGKTQPTKLNAYLKCFWKNSAGTSAACMKTAGINAAQVATCVTASNKEFSPSEKSLGLNKDEAVKFGVQGSPALVVNGTTISSGRDSASVLKAICSGFVTAPKECQTTLSATSPVAGFDDQASASASGGAAGGSCN